MRITNPSSKTMRIAPNLARTIKKIKSDVQTEFIKVHGFSPSITDSMASKLLGMYLDGDIIVRVTYKRKAINFRLKR